MATKQTKKLVYPRQRTGKDCTKVECVRYTDYSTWSCGNSQLNFCMNCKYAHVSQYERRVTT